MSTISGTVTTTAGITTANVVTGDLFEVLERASTVSLFVSAAAAGVVTNFQIGPRTLVLGGLVPGTNRFPLREDDGVTIGRGIRGERIFLTFNDGGTSRVVNFLIDIL